MAGHYGGLQRSGSGVKRMLKSLASLPWIRIKQSLSTALKMPSIHDELGTLPSETALNMLEKTQELDRPSFSSACALRKERKLRSPHRVWKCWNDSRVCDSHKLWCNGGRKRGSSWRRDLHDRASGSWPTLNCLQAKKRKREADDGELTGLPAKLIWEEKVKKRGQKSSESSSVLALRLNNWLLVTRTRKRKREWKNFEYRSPIQTKK